jgi:hypothetical protein
MVMAASYVDECKLLSISDLENSHLQTLVLARELLWMLAGGRAQSPNLLNTTGMDYDADVEASLLRWW